MFHKKLTWTFYRGIKLEVLFMLTFQFSLGIELCFQIRHRNCTVKVGVYPILSEILRGLRKE